jgi:hypothetical protein
MKTVVISGWSVGFQKIKFTEMLRSDLGYSLSGAKATMNAMLDNQRLELQIQDSEYERLLLKFSEFEAKIEW